MKNLTTTQLLQRLVTQFPRAQEEEAQRRYQPCEICERRAAPEPDLDYLLREGEAIQLPGVFCRLCLTKELYKAGVTHETLTSLMDQLGYQITLSRKIAKLAEQVQAEARQYATTNPKHRRLADVRQTEEN